MSPENRLQFARLGAGLIIIMLITAAFLIYQQFSSGILEETAHRLSIQYNAFSTGLAGK